MCAVLSINHVVLQLQLMFYEPSLDTQFMHSPELAHLAANPEYFHEMVRSLCLLGVSMSV